MWLLALIVTTSFTPARHTISRLSRWSPALFTSVFLLVTASSGWGQVGLCPIHDVQLAGITTEALDTMYVSVFDHALTIDSTEDSAVSKDIAAVRGWSSLVSDLNTFFTAHEFHWEKPTRMFCRFYFDRSGAIEYVLTDCKTPGFTQVTKMCLVMRNFAQSYHFPLRGSRPYSHCGMITFMDKKMGMGKLED